jgi:protoporphyrinogen/coproporphyrinogen III oxidase
MGYKQSIVVVGAGLSGLACAFRLKKLRFAPLVLERTERAGGLIASIQKNGFLFESGPQCPRFPAAAWQMVRELELDDEFIAGPARPNRYIFRHGELVGVPFSPAGMIATRLVGIAAKLRILADFFGSSFPPAREETLAEFVQRKFGTEVLENLVDPIVATVFLSEPERMGMESALPALVEFERAHGSISRGAIRARRSQKAKDLMVPNRGARNGRPTTLHVTDALPSLGSFRNGMEALPAKLAHELRESIRYRREIASIARGFGEKSSWHIQLSSGEKIETDHLVLAIPAYEAASYLGGAHPQLASRLSAIEYAPACVIGLAYARSQVAHPLDGFGFTVPRKEGLNIICTFWNSSLFPQRASVGKVILTSFVRNSEGGSSNSLRALTHRIEAENSGILGISGAPLDRMIWTEPRAMPQYSVGHAKRVSEIRSELASIPNLHLVGNYLSGRSIGDCIEIAEKVANEIAAPPTEICQS